MTRRSARLYRELAPWWPLISPPEEYDEEAAFFAALLERHARRPVREVMELGSGGGHTASHLKQRFRMTLVDLSPHMLAVSRKLNPECEHVRGDMRRARLGREFDAVLVHDAVMHMTTRRDLTAMARTAAAHLAPGGAALFVPDQVRETFRPGTSWGGSDGKGRSARYLEWTRAPERDATWFLVTFAYVLLQRGRPPRIEHDEMRLGLFARATWLATLREAGLRARAVTYDTTLLPGPTSVAFIGVRPGGTRRR